jgi:hypothetical protein
MSEYAIASLFIHGKYRLARSGFLEKTGERRNPDDQFDYSLTYQVCPDRMRHNSE